MTRTLTDDQIREIRRLRSQGRQLKVVARIVGCTWRQAGYYSRAVAGSREIAARRAADKRRSAAGVAARVARTRERELAAAEQSLRAVVQETRQAAATSPLYRPGLRKLGF